MFASLRPESRLVYVFTGVGRTLVTRHTTSRHKEQLLPQQHLLPWRFSHGYVHTRCARCTACEAHLRVRQPYRGPRDSLLSRRRFGGLPSSIDESFDGWMACRGRLTLPVPTAAGGRDSASQKHAPIADPAMPWPSRASSVCASAGLLRLRWELVGSDIEPEWLMGAPSDTTKLLAESVALSALRGESTHPPTGVAAVRPDLRRCASWESIWEASPETGAQWVDASAR